MGVRERVGGEGRSREDESGDEGGEESGGRGRMEVKGRVGGEQGEWR